MQEWYLSGCQLPRHSAGCHSDACRIVGIRSPELESRSNNTSLLVSDTPNSLHYLPQPLSSLLSTDSSFVFEAGSPALNWSPSTCSLDSHTGRLRPIPCLPQQGTGSTPFSMAGQSMIVSPTHLHCSMQPSLPVCIALTMLPGNFKVTPTLYMLA